MKKLLLICIILSVVLVPYSAFGAENLAKSATITSNTKSADTSFLTDGITEVEKGAQCTQTRSNTYFLFDFGKEVEVDTLKWYEFNSYKSRRLYGYKIETSADGEKFKKIAELSEENPICPDEITETRYMGTLKFNKVTTRYLKVTVRKAMDIRDTTKTAVGYTAELEAFFENAPVTPAPAPEVEKEEEDNSLYKIYVDGKKISFDVDPLMLNDRLLVPFRAICEALSMDVSWNDKEQKVTATKGANSIIMTIGNDNIAVNGNLVKSDVAPTLHNSRTVVPLRFLAEAIGCEVGWDGDTNTVTITTK